MKISFRPLLPLALFLLPLAHLFPENSVLLDGYFVFAEGGEFLSSSDTKNPNSYVLHKETVADFYIAKYEVTVGLYEKVMGKNPTRHKDKNRPVENISGYDCAEFCNALSRFEGLEECYSLQNGKWVCDFSKNGFRLPTLPK